MLTGWDPFLWGFWIFLSQLCGQAPEDTPLGHFPQDFPFRLFLLKYILLKMGRFSESVHEFFPGYCPWTHYPSLFSLSGRRSEIFHNARSKGPPAMGLNGYGPRGLGEHNRLNGNYYHHYRSQPAGINHSDDQRSDSKSIGNGDLANNSNYSVVLRPKKVNSWL